MRNKLTQEQVAIFKLKIASMVDAIEVSEFSNSKFIPSTYMSEINDWMDINIGLYLTEHELYGGFISRFNLNDINVRKKFKVQTRGSVEDHLKNVSNLQRNIRTLKQFVKLFNITSTEYKRMIPVSRKYLSGLEEKVLEGLMEGDGDKFKKRRYAIVLTDGEYTVVEAISIVDAISKANKLNHPIKAFKYKDPRNNKWTHINKTLDYHKYVVIVTDGLDRISTMIRVPAGLNDKGIQKYICVEAGTMYGEGIKIIEYGKRR